jgi:hypothetical protein
LERVLTRIVSPWRQFVPRRIRELEWFAVRANERVRERVESQLAGECECSDDIRRGNEGVGGGIGIVTASEVSVVRRDD